MTSLKLHKNHIDLSKDTLPINKVFDVVIVGSGAGGGIAAEILVQSGLSVAIVEEGAFKTAADFTLNEAQAYPDLYQEAMSRKTKDKGITVMQGRTVGGSTTVNWTSSFRTPEKTLNHWSEVHGVSGFSSEELAPWFKKVEQQLNISPWPIPPNENNSILEKGAHKLGWSAARIPRNVRGCANLGYCGMGCPIDAKQSMLVTTIPAAVKAGATLITNARCQKLIYRGEVVEHILLSPVDKNHQAKNSLVKLACNYVVLSAGAIGTPAILMRSKVPDPRALIGKRTFLHPVTSVLADMPDKVNAFYGAPQSVYSDEFLWRDGVTGKIGYKLEVPPIHPVIGSSIIPVHGEPHSQMMKRFPYFHASLALLRDGFNESSIGGQVELDRFNEPLLDYKANGYLWEGVKSALLNMAELQFAAGAKRIRPFHMDAQWATTWPAAKTMIESLKHQVVRTSLFSAHVMGGCAFGDSPDNSVVDSTGKSHFFNNLSVLDGSLFPTSLGVNPQLTIYAISAKLASGLSERLK
ncbi:GMC family oxidoreductase N-terminal domain-containing protein [Pleionea sediminis]|uniref:GMC family oxidoreductase N-terminal domain-containing protein n=1 Tax=Pleionea sediminis TaxID=2569479 RepID=UPI00118603CF|nr:GMC family oxidoreductase [Pleionea sediminis]